MRRRAAAGALTTLVLLSGCGADASPRAQLREAAARLNVEANEGDAQGLRDAAAELEALVSRQSGERELSAEEVERLLALSKRVRANAKLLDRTAPAPVVSRSPTPEPERTTRAPDPEPTTQAPQPTTEAPEPTTQAPEPTTEAPEPTTEAPEPTTEVPEPTTEAPEPTAPAGPTAPPQPTEPTEPAATAPVSPASLPPNT